MGDGVGGVVEGLEGGEEGGEGGDFLLGEESVRRGAERCIIDQVQVLDCNCGRCGESAYSVSN